MMALRTVSVMRLVMVKACAGGATKTMAIAQLDTRRARPAIGHRACGAVRQSSVVTSWSPKTRTTISRSITRILRLIGVNYFCRSPQPGPLGFPFFGFWGLFPLLLGVLGAVARHIELQDDGVVDEPIDGGGCRHRVLKMRSHSPNKRLLVMNRGRRS
jgi:hypothetical protein